MFVIGPQSQQRIHLILIGILAILCGVACPCESGAQDFIRFVEEPGEPPEAESKSWIQQFLDTGLIDWESRDGVFQQRRQDREADGGGGFQLNRILPIGGDQLLSKGFNLSLPYGTGGSVLYVDQPFIVDSARISVNGLPEIPVPVLGFSDVKSRTTSTTVRGDAWLFPFLNVYGLAGYTEGITQGNLTLGNVPGLPNVVTVPVSNRYNGPVYGGGVLAIVAYKNVFASLDWNSTVTLVHQADSAVSAQQYTPRVGVLGKSGAVWIGGCYQKVQNTFRNDFDVGGVPISLLTNYSAAQPWNFVYGIRWSRMKHLEMNFEHGFCGRHQVLGNLAVRF